MRTILILFGLLFSVAAFGQQQMFLRGSAAGSGDVAILDGTPTPDIAYCACWLVTAYAGPILRVRRDSDNTEQDIDRSGQDIDQASLTAFCSGANCFVTTLYDQTGGGQDATQAVAGEQPKIYDSVTGIVLDTGFPALNFTDNLTQNLTLPGLTNQTFNSYFLTSTSDESYVYMVRGSQTSAPWGYVALRNSPLTTFVNYQGASSLYVNNVLESPANRGEVYTATNGRKIIVHYGSTGTELVEWNFGNYGNNTEISYTGNLYGIIHFFTDQSATQTATHDALNAYFSIY